MCDKKVSLSIAYIDNQSSLFSAYLLHKQKKMAPLLLVFTLLCSIVSKPSFAYNFNVGGRNGWVPNPSENYNNWAERNRFQVNDTLAFKYKKGLDSVLVVSKDDYYNCNTNNPIMKMDSGTSIFKFDHSGPFFFISGNKQNCLKGQRLIVVVLAFRPPKSSSPPPIPHSPATSPSPKSPSPSSSVSPSPAANSPKSVTPSVSPSPAANSPQSNSPSSSVSPSPAANSPRSISPSSPVSPSPAANSPQSNSPSSSASPSPAESNSPSSSASPSPAAISPQSISPSPSSLSPSPAANSPESSSPSPSAEGPGISTPEGSSALAPPPDSGETADVNSPAPTNSKSGSQTVTASSRMIVMAVGVVILSVVNGV